MNNTWGSALNSSNNNNNGFNYGRTNFLPHYEIVKVNGEAGARAFQMGPNSNMFLADATNPNIIWLVQTDGAGYLTPTPLDVSIHKTEQQTASSLEERVKHLEDMYEQLNSGFSKQPKKQHTKQQQSISDRPLDTTS